MPTVSLNQQLILKPDGSPGTDDDGSRDGRFLTGLAPAAAWQNESVYWTIHDLRPGFINIMPPFGGAMTATSISWLRFNLPFPSITQEPFIRFVRAFFVFHWNPNLAVPLGHPDRDANVNRGHPGFPRIRIVPNWHVNFQQAPIPASSPHGNNIWNFAGTNGRTIDWDDNATCCEFGTNVGVVTTPDFSQELFDMTVNAENIHPNGTWSPGDHLTFLLDVDLFSVTRQMTREWHFRSWSWNAENNSSEHSTSPLLVVEYTTDMPAPDTYDEQVIHDLIIIHEWDEITISECPTHELVILQEFTVQRVFNKSITSVLLIDQDVSGTFILDATVEHVLVLEQEFATLGSYGKSVTHTLGITQFVLADVGLYKEIQHELTWVQTITVVKCHSESIEHSLFIDQLSHLVMQFEQSITDHLWLIQEIGVELVGGEAHQIVHTLEITQTIDLNCCLHFDLEDTITFEQTILGILWSGGGPSTTVVCGTGIYEYQPQGDTPTKPAITLLYDFKIDYPTTSPTATVTLPAPVMGDIEELTVTRIQRKSRGGDAISYKATQWPTFEIRQFSFQTLSDAQKDALLNLIDLSLGDLVRVRDHENRTWDGLIVNPNGEFAEVFNECGHSAQFWFQPVAEV